MTEAITLQTTTQKRNLNAIFFAICCILCLSIFMLGTSQVAYCDDVTDAAATAISNAITEMSTKIYQTMRSIITPLTIIAFAFAGFQFLLGGAQGTEKSKKDRHQCRYRPSGCYLCPRIWPSYCDLVLWQWSGRPFQLQPSCLTAR